MEDWLGHDDVQYKFFMFNRIVFSLLGKHLEPRITCYNY